MTLEVKQPGNQNCQHYNQPRARIKTGTYTGDGADDRNINIGVNLAAMSNPVLIINSAETGVGKPATLRTEHAQGLPSYPLDSTQTDDNMIQAFTATGFQIGSHGNVNTNNYLYVYVAMWEEVT